MKLDLYCIRDIVIGFQARKDASLKAVTQIDLDLTSYDTEIVTHHLHQIHNANFANVMFSKETPYDPRQTFIIGLTDNGTSLYNCVQNKDILDEFLDAISTEYSLLDLNMFVYAMHSYLSTRYGLSSEIS